MFGVILMTCWLVGHIPPFSGADRVGRSLFWIASPAIAAVAGACGHFVLIWDAAREFGLSFRRRPKEIYQMAETKDKVRFLHWAVKLFLTMLVGGPFAIGAFFVPANAMPSVMPQASFGPLCAGIVVLAAMVFATFLHLREGNRWSRSLLMGVVVGLAGAAIIMMIGFGFVIWFLSNIQLV